MFTGVFIFYLQKLPCISWNFGGKAACSVAGASAVPVPAIGRRCRVWSTSFKLHFCHHLLPPPAFFFHFAKHHVFLGKKKITSQWCDGILIAKCDFVRDCLYCKISYAALQTGLGFKGCYLFFFLSFFSTRHFFAFPRLFVVCLFFFLDTFFCSSQFS